jgi:opacity protein-like surface antigen
MRKFIISAALAASTIAVAAPAAAQWYPPQPQGNAYGYDNYGQVRRLDARIDAMQRQIKHLDSRDILSEREARNLRNQSNDVERRLRVAARNGLNGWEANDIERRVQRLEVRIQREARDGNGWRNGYYNNAGWSDRDRDGLDDRYERDRGTNYDEDRDRD